MANTKQYENLQLSANLELLARQVVEGFITGLHKSPFHGFSVEFAEHRLYNTGDSVKNIDWKLFAKTDKLFSKRYEEETNLRCQFVIDSSSSMYFPDDSYNKLTFAVQSTACLMYLLKKQRDAFGLSLFTDQVSLNTKTGDTSLTSSSNNPNDANKSPNQNQPTASTSGSENNIAQATTSPPQINTTNPKPAPATKNPIPTVTTKLTYTEAVQKFINGYRFQFAQCHGWVGVQYLKAGSEFMLDNRDPVSHTVKIGNYVYPLKPYDFIITSIKTPSKYYVTCDGGGSAFLLVEP